MTSCCESDAVIVPSPQGISHVYTLSRGIRISKIFERSVRISLEELLLDPIASLQDDDKGTLSDDDIGTFADDDDAIESDELLTSLREFEELEAIHEEEELLLDPVDELVELSLELRMTFCEELLTSLRMLEEDAATLDEELSFWKLEELIESMLLEDSRSGTRRDELLLVMAASEPPSILLLLDPIASRQDDDVGAFSDDDNANELDKFSDHASNALEESSPQATINNNEERGNKNRFINTSLTVSPFVNILSTLPKINIFMQQIVKNLIIFQYFYKILHQIFLYATLVAYRKNSTLNNPMNFQIQHAPFTFYNSTDISISQKRVY